MIFMIKDTPQVQVSKLQMALKGVLGFVLVVTSINLAYNAVFWAQGNLGLLNLEYYVAVLFVLSGIFYVIESVMCMNAEVEKNKKGA